MLNFQMQFASFWELSVHNLNTFFYWVDFFFLLIFGSSLYVTEIIREFKQNYTKKYEIFFLSLPNVYGGFFSVHFC